MKTYNPLPSWPPAFLAIAVLAAGYVIGPAIARHLATTAMRAIDDNLADFIDAPTTT